MTYFIPLDGQQRLTTLFLLHWYLAQITPDQDLCDRLLTALHRADGLARFTYETRDPLPLGWLRDGMKRLTQAVLWANQQVTEFPTTAPRLIGEAG